jgi:hypothetical protein
MERAQNIEIQLCRLQALQLGSRVASQIVCFIGLSVALMGRRLVSGSVNCWRCVPLWCGHRVNIRCLYAAPVVCRVQGGRQILAGGSLLRSGQTEVGRA